MSKRRPCVESGSLLRGPLPSLVSRWLRGHVPESGKSCGTVARQHWDVRPGHRRQRTDVAFWKILVWEEDE